MSHFQTVHILTARMLVVTMHQFQWCCWVETVLIQEALTDTDSVFYSHIKIRS